ncbi:Non-hemolytic phospholipase C [Streptomyces sp. RB5]|uniref:phospholipase C n=1 Tax=Streptomyces smaragdinus TaxID=2585196 RepID=A0A7K0CFN0_9ACTN|nr:phospholipase C, phosphocholine-specific [Streptomyces smaragdinus]MQY12268.1 Non-hemolytic phospholipase C [Streptomyces smaragdinus]
MSPIDRRRFLRTAGATAAFTALADSIDRAAAIPPARGSGSIRDVEHIVVLMQENESFDHYLGRLSGVRGFGDPRPVVLPSGRTVWHQQDGERTVLPFRPDDELLGSEYLQGLNHDWAGGQAAYNGGAYDNWIAAKTAATMSYLDRGDIPFHYALADAFTVCDAYFCSFIGATDPNRYYLWSGSNGSDGTGGGPVLGNEERGYGWRTYPERLEAAGVSWKIYQDVGDGLDAGGSWGWIEDAFRGNYGDNSLLYFDNYREAQPGDPLYEKARTGTNAKAGEDFFHVLRSDVRTGKLPQVSWIVAPEAFSEHSNWPPNYGAWYISRVLDALTSDPEVWSRTALFVTYDENDGFFDHVVPPFPPLSPEQGASTADTSLDVYRGGVAGYARPGPYGFGPRVPMFVVSPWSTGGYVCSETFDHTSIIRFTEERFGVREPNISPWRRAVAGDLTSAFDFRRKDTRVRPLPDTSGFTPPDRERHPSYPLLPPADGAMPGQERGGRPARPLRYAPVVDGRRGADGFEVSFSGGAHAGACFYATSAADGQGPRTYTAEAGKSIAGAWATDGAYDVSVWGPNGSLAAFRGATLDPGAEVTARHDARTGDVTLTLDNGGPRERRLTVTNAYGGASRTLRVRPGARVRHTVELRHSARWFDVSVTDEADPAFLRRFAGHVETGEPGVSDPALGTD